MKLTISMFVGVVILFVVLNMIVTVINEENEIYCKEKGYEYTGIEGSGEHYCYNIEEGKVERYYYEINWGIPVGSEKDD